MAATGNYNAVTDILTVTGDGLPTPVSYGTFPNANNPNSVTSYTFSHAFTDRGGDNTSGGSTVPLGIVGIAANGVALFNPCRTKSRFSAGYALTNAVASAMSGANLT